MNRKPGQTNVFFNKFKKGNHSAPDFTAVDLQLEELPGQMLQVAMWGPKKAANGSDYYTLQVKKFVPKEPWKAPSRTEDPPKPGYTHSGGYVGGVDEDDTPF